MADARKDMPAPGGKKDAKQDQESKFDVQKFAEQGPARVHLTDNLGLDDAVEMVTLILRRRLQDLLKELNKKSGAEKKLDQAGSQGQPMPTKPKKPEGSSKDKLMAPKVVGKFEVLGKLASGVLGKITKKAGTLKAPTAFGKMRAKIKRPFQDTKREDLLKDLTKLAQQISENQIKTANDLRKVLVFIQAAFDSYKARVDAKRRKVENEQQGQLAEIPEERSAGMLRKPKKDSAATIYNAILKQDRPALAEIIRLLNDDKIEEYSAVKQTPAPQQPQQPKKGVEKAEVKGVDLLEGKPDYPADASPEFVKEIDELLDKVRDYIKLLGSAIPARGERDTAEKHALREVLVQVGRKLLNADKEGVRPGETLASLCIELYNAFDEFVKKVDAINGDSPKGGEPEKLRIERDFLKGTDSTAIKVRNEYVGNYDGDYLTTKAGRAFKLHDDGALDPGKPLRIHDRRSNGV